MNAHTTLTDWRTIKSRVQLLNPLLYKALQHIPDADNFPILLAHYPFGAEITSHGNFMLPWQGKVLPYADLPKEILTHLDYPWQGIPFGMVLKNSIESFSELPTHIVPYNLLLPGKTFSLMTIFEEEESSHLIPNAYSVSAGCRSLLTLPQIAHSQYNERLKRKYGVFRHLCPKTFAAQWNLFYELTQAAQFHCSWSAELLFFSREIIEALDNVPAAREILLMKVWRGMTFYRNYATYSLIWSAFIDRYASLASKNTPMIIETVKHLINIAIGAAPGFVPAVDDTAGPVSELTHALIHVYRIRFYYPVFMQLARITDKKPIYYSMQKPTFLHALPQKNTPNQTINALKAIKTLVEQFIEAVMEDTLPFTLKNSYLHRRLQQVKFDFYHPKGTKPLNTNIKELINQDARFAAIINRDPANKSLGVSDHSFFFHGCIRITHR